ncbi:hypothetical protein J4E90_001142 [Alternaria incomplexa]|uniref:uncharacterized protein n=1 Tax=Alternaria incomplexa TaxID=1187928 RepID=UPI0022202A26|nr:uncharacterized protein J4E90_001142 [Alternaria incomplexa]KAI4922709.1 hypothetical protein J4E90_001142 [Alternaria incomplexa]
MTLPRQNSPTVAQSGALLRPGDDAVALKREAERRTLFQKTSNNALDIPNGYRKVEVLILRWDESIDEFKDGHNKEVQRLKWLFSKGLGYGVTIANIKNTRNPQVAFNLEILQHVHKHDDEDNLLIVYYTGHGSQVVDGNVRNLELSATEGSSVSGNFAPVAFWGQAEEPLRTLATADVLSILDCCCASTAAVKGRSTELRAYQLLAASTLEGYTNEPGEKSFTTAFCDSLEELIEESKEESFSVIKLWERINTKRASNAALIWDRL